MTKTGIQTVSKLLLGIFLISLITMLTYYPTTQNQFVWDSHTYIVSHWFWLSKLNLNHIIWMLLSLDVSNWHPLTWLSWAIDYQLYGGLVPWGYHFSSNILHTINSLLVFTVALVVFGLNSPGLKGYPFRIDNNALIAAFLAALIFAVHPQHVESVAWVAERKDLLCQFFLLLSMLTYVKYATCHKHERSRWFRGTLALFVMALMSKPMAVTFPTVLLLIDIYPLRRTHFVRPLNPSIKQQSIYGLLKEKLPFLFLSILTIFITLYAQQGALGNTPISLYLRVLNAFNSITFYLTQFWLPTNFAALYPFLVEASERITWKDFVPLISVLGLTVATLFAWVKGRPAWLIAWLFYLVTLSPVLGLIQAGQQGAADRYTYFPILPIYLLVGAGILIFLDQAKPAKRFVVILAILSVIFLLANKTRQQIQVWETDGTLWSNAVTLYPDNPYAALRMGVTQYNYHSYEKAIFYFEESDRLMPGEIITISWLGLTNLQLGRYKDAITLHVELGTAPDSKSNAKIDQFCIQYNIGWAFAKMDMFVESSDLFSRVDPNSVWGHDAGTWMEWLKITKQIDEKIPTAQHLPGVCERLLLAK